MVIVKFIKYAGFLRDAWLTVIGKGYQKNSVIYKPKLETLQTFNFINFTNFMNFINFTNFFLFLYGISLSGVSQKTASADSITLFFVGDVMQHSPQINGAWNPTSGEHDYKPCFQYIRPYWEKADYVIANLETTLDNKNFSGYPQFCAPWQLARDLKACGVDLLTTNNNHSCDKCHEGIR